MIISGRKSVQAKETVLAVRPIAVIPPSGGKTKRTAHKLSDREKKMFRDMLMALREDVARQINKLKGDSLTRDDAGVSEEDGTDAFDRQFALSLASSENDALFLIEESLRKVDSGTYGICDGCGCMIEFPRLKALPFVQMCIGCQSETERKRMKFRPAHR
ncbi:MAG: hypothetical protein A2498_03165 [Lentisphaerae bacterium RIFOXYC12_FULL_60_16]|nr:MAG: hypothetical protein A2498_03165 [Lentisphaerae bacterium RIFOXYC12_FULL_60_16]OGV85264.1 MAG: hypothetical protein A2340_01650 [Lentisphaerae bacterium RIFOXYB12_FULL_60_10]